MDKILRTYKFKLYPSKEQANVLWSHANLCNLIYNHFLEVQINNFKEFGKFLPHGKISAQLTKLKNSETKFKVVDAQVRQQAIIRLSNAIARFKREKKKKHYVFLGKGFPHYRSCKNFFNLTYPQEKCGYKLKDNYFYSKKYGNIEFFKHRKIIGKIATTTISYDGTFWYLLIVTDISNIKIPLKDKKNIVGIDIGLINIVATSDNETIKNNTHYKWKDKQIDKLKSRNSKTQKGSRRNKFLSKTIRRLYGEKSRKQLDFLHKVSKTLSSKYDTICIEDLELMQMSESEKTGLNRALRNASLGKFITFLEYKTNKIIEVNPAYTSQVCNKCGKLNHLTLNDREMICSCGNREDRDINAARNIQCLGEAIILGANQGISIIELYTYKGLVNS
jgi:putative transposase